MLAILVRIVARFYIHGTYDRLESPKKTDKLIGDKFGQDIIDSLSVLEAVVPTLHADLWSHVKDLFPLLGMALRSKYAVIRQCVSRCFAAICDVMTVDAMRFVIDQVLPYLGDAENLANRQGATELVYSMFLFPQAVDLLLICAQTWYRSWTIRRCHM